MLILGQVLALRLVFAQLESLVKTREAGGVVKISSVCRRNASA